MGEKIEEMEVLDSGGTDNSGSAAEHNGKSVERVLRFLRGQYLSPLGGDLRKIYRPVSFFRGRVDAVPGRRDGRGFPGRFRIFSVLSDNKAKSACEIQEAVWALCPFPLLGFGDCQHDYDAELLSPVSGISDYGKI